jgi:hypothetical protein
LFLFPGQMMRGKEENNARICQPIQWDTAGTSVDV